MKRYLRVAAAVAFVLAAGAVGGFTRVSGGGSYEGYSAEAASHGVCVPDLSRPEYLASYAAQVAVGTVTERIRYERDVPGSGDPGGVVLSRFEVEQPLKGRPPATLTVAQGVAEHRDGSLHTLDPWYELMEPGVRYTVALASGGEGTPGRWVWGAERMDPPNSTAVSDRWQTAVSAHAEVPYCNSTDD